MTFVGGKTDAEEKDKTEKRDEGKNGFKATATATATAKATAKQEQEQKQKQAKALAKAEASGGWDVVFFAWLGDEG